MLNQLKSPGGASWLAGKMGCFNIKLLAFLSVLLLVSISFSFAQDTNNGSIEVKTGKIAQNDGNSYAVSEIIQNMVANAEASVLPQQEETTPADSNNYAVEPADASYDAPKPNYNSDDFVKINPAIVEKQATSFESPNANFFGSNSATGDVIPLDASDNSCSSTSSNQLGTYYYKSYIDYSGDVDWYKGYKPQSFLLRILMIPPLGKDYDIEIWEDCSTFRKSCTAGSGSTELCNTTVEGDFYVKVYGYNNAYSPNAPYFIVAGYDATCTASSANGSPTKSSYACNELLKAQNQRFTNNNSSAISYHYFESLNYPSNNIAGESQVLNNSLSANSNIYWTTGGYNPSSSGWAEAGNYTFKSFIMGFCPNGGISSANAFAYPYVPTAPCSCSITANDGQPTKSSFACDERLETINNLFDNTGTYPFNYTVHTRLFDPAGSQIDSWDDSTGYTLNSGEYTYRNSWYYPPVSGWLNSGSYRLQTYLTGTCSNGNMGKYID